MSATCGSCGQVKRRKRAPRVREASEFAADLRRWLRAYAARVADSDDVDLGDMLAIRADLDAAIAAAVTGQREIHGRSWADIARAAGISRQAAQQRWGKP